MPFGTALLDGYNCFLTKYSSIYHQPEDCTSPWMYGLVQAYSNVLFVLHLV